jgi:HD superfamily phosphohydrolase
MARDSYKPWESNIKSLFSFFNSGTSTRQSYDYVDPIYGPTKLSPEMLDLINTAPVRRLSAVTQQTAALTDRGMEINHSRLTHSIGVSILGERMAEQLGLDPNERNILKACGLLHDVRHGPYSHLYDHMKIDGVYFDHDSRSIDFLQAPDLSIALGGLGLSPHEVFSNLTDKRDGSNQLALPLGYLAKEVLDRVDYLQRDTASDRFIEQTHKLRIREACENLLSVLTFNRDQNLIVCKEEHLDVMKEFNMWRAFAFQMLPFDRATQVVNAYIRREAERSFDHMSPEEKNVFLKESTSYSDEQFLNQFRPHARRILESRNNSEDPRSFESHFAVLNLIKAENLTPHGVQELRVHPTLQLIKDVCGRDFCAKFEPLVVRRPKPASPVTFNVESRNGYIEARTVQPLALPEELEEMTHGHLKPGRIPHGCDASEIMIVCERGRGQEDEGQLNWAQLRIEDALIDRRLIQPRESTVVRLDALISRTLH